MSTPITYIALCVEQTIDGNFYYLCGRWWCICGLLKACLTNQKCRYYHCNFLSEIKFSDLLTIPPRKKKLYSSMFSFPADSRIWIWNEKRSLCFSNGPRKVYLGKGEQSLQPSQKYERENYIVCVYSISK